MKNLELKAIYKPESNKEYLIKLTNSSQWVISKYIPNRGWKYNGKILTGIKEIYSLPSYKKKNEDKYQPEEITAEEFKKKRKELSKDYYVPTDETVYQIIAVERYSKWVCSTPERARKSLQNAGILNKQGKLAKQYRQK